MTDSTHDPITLDVIPGTKSFPQSGSWNMLDLSTAPIRGSFGALSRYSAARVNPYAAVVGETLCSIFQLGPRGRKNIDGAVEKLKVVGTLGKTLEIGFAIEDIVRIMARTDQGRICVAFCGALKECYSDDMAVEILLEMARLVNVDAQYMPSSQSWKELLAACAGTLASSKFPLLAEHYMQLPKNDHRLGAYHRFDCSPGSVRSCSSPKSIAEALFGLARITRSDMQAVTFIGGNDLGWLAAVAQWFFDLRLVIYLADEQEEELCHRNCDTVLHQNCELDDAQVKFIFQRAVRNTEQSLTTVGQTFLLDDVSKLFEEESRGPDAVLVSGRVEWKNALNVSFGSDFQELMRLRESLGGAIGSAARLFKGLAHADKFFPMTYRTACTSYCDASYGLGFINNTLHWFPELAKLKDLMQKAASASMDKARKEYELCISMFRRGCGCLTCQSSTTGHIIPTGDGDEEMTPAPDMDESDEESILDYDPDRYCLVVLVETIICVSRLLSNIVLEDKALLPVRSGFERAYGKQLNQRRCALGGRRALEEIGQIAFCLDFDNNFTFGPMSGGDGALDIRIQTILSLFSGKDAPLTSSNHSALCVNGITAFLGFLRNSSTGKETMSRIHVIPGRIVHDGKSYVKLTDRVTLQPPASDFTKAIQVSSIAHPEWHESLSIQESYTALECLLEIRKGNDSESSPFLRVGPAGLTSQLSTRTGLVSCRLPRHSARTEGISCRERVLFSTQEIQRAVKSKKPLSQNGKSILILDCKDLDNAIPAVASTSRLSSEYSVYFVSEECTTCCIKEALSVDRPERPEFCFFILRD